MPTVYNPSDRPVVLDRGRTVGGRERAEIRPRDRRGRAALAAGRLVEIVDPPAPAELAEPAEPLGEPDEPADTPPLSSDDDSTDHDPEG